jgi:hypothetical protein
VHEVEGTLFDARASKEEELGVCEEAHAKDEIFIFILIIVSFTCINSDEQ